MTKTTKEVLVHLAALGLIFLAAAGFVVFAAHQEAKTYKRLTGVEVTTWDAMWVQLRVDRPPLVQERNK